MAPTDSHLREEKISSEELLQGHFLHAFRDTVRMPDGQQATREYFLHPGAAMVIAQLPNGQVLMERQYRYPVQSVMVELPAGKINPGEKPLDGAKRELLEETGYTAGSWAKAGLLHPGISYSTEVIEIWFAKDLKPGQPRLDPGEFLDVFTASPEQLLQWCRDGTVTDGKTLAGAMWLQNVLSGAWTLDWQHGPGG
jgi:ADP-ribose pyrophosphatase